MFVAMAGVDTGHYTDFAYDFIDTNKLRVTKVVGVRGDKESKFRKYDADTPSFKPAMERKLLFLIDVNYVKDGLARSMNLNWNSSYDESQPPGFMNFPIPSGGMYLLDSYFEHFESEHKIRQVDDDGGVSFRWVKKSSNSQNHFWDVRVYNIALRDIIVEMVCTEFKLKKATWVEFCKILLPK
jgi:phage terminase large subunit GpA-like protein